MAEHELEATRRMRDLGVNAPEPLEAFDHDGYGIVVLEYVPEFTPLDDLSATTVEGVAPDLFEALARVHEAGLAHGDLRAENVLVVDGDLYFIDATKVRDSAIEDARAYDVACALAALEPLVGARLAVEAAAERYDDRTLVRADSYLDFVTVRPDHDFDTVAVKGYISSVVG
jgi:tRNA A-37 threonylcarbamoyl transferase component Bud32